jgi:hypothetical protein
MRTELIKKICVWAFCIIMVFSLAACGVSQDTKPDNKETEKENETETEEAWEQDTDWDKDFEKRIKQDYLTQFVINVNPDATVKDIIIKKYYGTYNGCIVVTTNFDYYDYDMAVVYIDNINGVEFQYGYWLIKVWFEGTFYDLIEAAYRYDFKRNELEKIKSDYEQFLQES